MSIKKTIGGDRLGSGKKMQVDLKTYNRSTHDLGYIWRSTMSAGTLVPFIKELALPGDTFDIDLDIDVKTHPTIGPLFGSYKVQLDVFQAPVRLYQSGLHNNAIGIGMKMQDIKLPQMQVGVANKNSLGTNTIFANMSEDDIEKLANNPSSLLSHLDITGAGIFTGQTGAAHREMNALPYLAYWDIYKNYYANKQEEEGAFINANEMLVNAVGGGKSQGTGPQTWFKHGSPSQETNPFPDASYYQIEFDGVPQEDDIENCFIYISPTELGNPVFRVPLTTYAENVRIQGDSIRFSGFKPPANPHWELGWGFDTTKDPENYQPRIEYFPLENIDEMREMILAANKYSQFTLTAGSITPYGESLRRMPAPSSEVGWLASNYSQQGLALKTYQSDMFNNWMSTEWVDNATTGINAITAVDTSDGSFTIDALNLAGKVYDMLNRIAISGGTYDDWVETVYTHKYINRAETPIYHGGLSRELVFQEVVSNSESDTGQPLGTLAGKGVMAQRKKGGSVTIKVDEPSYIIGIVSLTPRIDYSQGNKWDTGLKTMDDLHKPALDEIGFQDLITEQMAWYTTDTFVDGTVTQKSAGKQPAWINYMTNVNKVRGNFALRNNEMFMTLNRRYEAEILTGDEPEDDTIAIKDLTTYIDPAKFNFIFADTDLTSQNFWVQIATDITARRKMSAKIMPNL